MQPKYRPHPVIDRFINAHQLNGTPCLRIDTYTVEVREGLRMVRYRYDKKKGEMRKVKPRVKRSVREKALMNGWASKRYMDFHSENPRISY